MIFDMGKNLGDMIGNAIGGVAQSLSGFGSAMSTAVKTSKEASLSAQALADAMKFFGVPINRGKGKSLFKCDPAVWGSVHYMKTRNMTVDGLVKGDVMPPFTGTFSTSSSSTTSTTSTR